MERYGIAFELSPRGLGLIRMEPRETEAELPIEGKGFVHVAVLLRSSVLP